MFSHKTLNQKAKESIKKSWNENDITGIIRVGVDNFMNTFFNDSVSFQTYLDEFSLSCDKFILNTSKQKNYKYISGKLILELEAPTTLHLMTNFYFQNSNNEYIHIKKEKLEESCQFNDWDTEPELIKLQNGEKLEYVIETPVEAM